MKKQKTITDHLFDCLLIVAPLVFLLPVDVYAKTMLVFYLFYLPYLTYVFYKETVAAMETKKLQAKKVVKKVKKKEEVEVFV